MPFEYIGPESLIRPEVFTQILTSAVEDTGLVNHFSAMPEYAEIDRAFTYFESIAFWVVTTANWRPRKKLSILVAAAIHCVSLYRIIDKERVTFVDERIVGLHASAVRKNPNELVALTFGLAVAEIEARWERSPGAIVFGAPSISLKAISPSDIRDAIRTIAENRNRDLRAKGGTGKPDLPFRQLLPLMGKLRAARFRSGRL